MSVSISFLINDFNTKTNFDYIDYILDTIRNNNETISWDMFQKIVDYILLQINKWNIKYTSLEKEFLKIRERNKKLGLDNTSKKGITDYDMQQALKEYDMALDKIFIHTKEGYYLLHRIRESFTGQNIQYSILDKSGKNYFETILSLDDILQYTYLSKVKDDKNDTNLITDFSLRIGSLKNQIRKTLKGQAQLNTQVHASDLYLQILENYKQSLDNRKMNRGHIYEVDFYLRNEKKYSGARLKNWERSSALISAAIKASLNSTSQLKGGDLGQYQLKNISNASAQLFSVNGIKNAFDDIVKTLSVPNKTQLRKGLISLFTQKIEQNKGAFTHSLERAANQEAKKGIEDFLKGII